MLHALKGGAVASTERDPGDSNDRVFRAFGMRVRLTGILSRTSTVYIVLAAGLLLTAAAAYLAERQVLHEARLKFEGVVSDWPDAIEARIRAYADILLGIRGMYIAADSVSRAEFHEYIKSLDLDRRYPGVQVIHYGRRISAAERASFEAEARRDRSVDPRGYPGFAINPPGERAEYVVVEYVEPMAGNETALGLDLAGDPVRFAALERMRDSGSSPPPAPSRSRTIPRNTRDSRCGCRSTAPECRSTRSSSAAPRSRAS